MSEEVKEEGSFKIKKKPGKPKKLTNKGESIKVDLSKKEDPVEEEVTKVVIDDAKEEAVIKEPVKEVVEETTEEKVIPIQEVTEEKVEEIKEPVIETAPEPAKPEINLPENIEKLVKFMEDTGGTVEDYVRLSADYSTVNDDALVREYYKQTKPHLDIEEVNFLLEDNFSFDEDMDEERDIRKKKLAFKEEIAKARNFLEDTKSKYYDEIKLRPGVTQDQQKAMDFFNRYNEDQETAIKQHEDFKSKTNNYFNDEFKGFEFDVSGKKFRYGVQDPSKLAEDQSNINNFVGKFLNKEGEVTDTKGYHKALFMASNADTIINHFYEQGKSDATKDIIGKSKNPSTDVRQPAKTGFINGLKVKSVSAQDSSKLRIKTKKYN
jgi:hypothetical protein